MTSTDNSDEAKGQPAEGRDETLSKALESTLENLNISIERMEEIVQKFESGDAELDDSIRLLAEANELAVSSSKELDQAVQKVLYQSDDEPGSEVEGEDVSETAAGEGSRES